jgi:hypothetical protein
MKVLHYLLIALFIYTPRNIFGHEIIYTQFIDSNSEKIESSISRVLSGEEQEEAFSKHVNDIYIHAGLGKTGMDKEILRRGLVGFYNMQKKNLLSTKNIITLIDYNKPSKDKRLWIIDVERKDLLQHTHVAHGKKSGEDKAVYFSNKPSSNMSSLGFFVTQNTYQGKHGLSLIIDGLDTKFNTNAKLRSIVIHGADYVCETFINDNGRLGRSHGCPAVPTAMTEEIVKTISDGTCLYIHYQNPEYSSTYLDEKTAYLQFLKY